MADIGIDYGFGRTNIDTTTGIRYGVISQHSLSGDALNDLEGYYGEATCPTCLRTENLYDPDDERIEDEDWNEGKDYACAGCKKCYWSEEVFSEECLGLTYSDAEYQIDSCLDSDLIVTKSPYYTFAQFCSPCVPGAGNLNDPMAEGVKTYCLGSDWFEGGVAPYPVYRVGG